MKGHRALRSWRGEAPVRSWLLRIVANDARNAVRARVPATPARGALRRAARAARRPIRSGCRRPGDDEARALLALLGRLDERDRAVLACRFVAGLSERRDGGGPRRARWDGEVAHARALAPGAARALDRGGGDHDDRRRLEARLGALGAAMRFPRATRSPTTSGGDRGDAPAGTRWRRAAARRRGLVLLVGAAVVAVPDSRHAVARWLGLERAADSSVVGTLPPVGPHRARPGRVRSPRPPRRADVVPFVAPALGRARRGRTRPAVATSPCATTTAAPRVLVTTLPGTLDDSRVPQARRGRRAGDGRRRRAMPPACGSRASRTSSCTRRRAVGWPRHAPRPTRWPGRRATSSSRVEGAIPLDAGRSSVAAGLVPAELPEG